MKKSSILVPVVAALAVWSSPAAADPIPSGTLVLGAERLTGFYHASGSIGPSDLTVNKISLFVNEPSGVYDLPRVGFDGFVIDGLSLGGTLGVAHGTTKTSVSAGGVTGSVEDTTTDFLFAPRVGYATMFSENIGIWPRGGFSYFSQASENAAATTNLHFFSINIEAAFLFKLAPNFAITAGPTLDVSLDGGQKTTTKGPGSTSVTLDASYTAFGITSGLVVLL